MKPFLQILCILDYNNYIWLFKGNENTRAMIDNNEIHMVIDENYTATIRDLKAIEAYLAEQTTISKYFGEITYINDDCDKDFRVALKLIRHNHLLRFKAINNFNKGYLVIDENTTVEIGNLTKLEALLKEQKSLSPIFGKLRMPNGTWAAHLMDRIHKIIANHISSFNKVEKAGSPHKDYVGDYYIVYRNQGDRDGAVVSYSGDDILIEYEMPNGTTALNIIKPDGSYKSISYSKLQNSKKWMKNLDQNFLINNPQSGNKFQIK